MSFAKVFERQTPAVRAFARWLEPCSDAGLESMAARSQAATIQHFGRVMRLFAPLYLSNECINNCKYCGFSRDNPILRVTLPVAQVVAEARHLGQEGFRNILLVAGEHPKFVSNGYLEACIRAVREEAGVPGVSLEVGPMETAEYRPLVAAGAEALIVYQEDVPPADLRGDAHGGSKRDFDWRLECPERAYAAGFRRLGLGALFGLHDGVRKPPRSPRTSIISCATAGRRTFPSACRASGRRPGGSRRGTRWATASWCTDLRLPPRIPQVGIVLSTREPAELRDAVIPLGVTMMSAGSHTEPGGYTGVGRDDLHLTVRGRRLETAAASAPDAHAEGQFDIADTRSPAEVAATLRALHGLEPVWKDWDEGLLERTAVSPPHPMSSAGYPIQVRVNDEPRPATGGQPLVDFIASLGVPPAGILVERNGLALLKSEWEQTRLADGDRIEILRVVAGG